MNTAGKISFSTLLLFTLVLFFSCSQKRDGIRIAVAANFASTMNEIVDSFKISNPGSEIIIIQGSSGKLTGQILNGANYDIFFSADSVKPAILYYQGFTKQKPKTYALGKLILFTKNNIRLTGNLSSLGDKNIKHVAIANPILAPYGKASIEAIKNSGINFDTTKIVYGENILQTFHHIDLAADIGFISKSLINKRIASNEYTENINWIDVDTTLYPPIKQDMIILNNNSVLTKKLFEYMNSKTAKDIITKYGYSL